MFGGTRLKVIRDRCKKENAVAFHTLGGAVYLDGQSLTGQELLQTPGFFDELQFAEMEARSAAASVAWRAPAIVVPPTAVWTGSVSPFSLLLLFKSELTFAFFGICVVSQLRLDASDYINVLPLRALYLHGRQYPPQDMATPLFPSNTIDYKGSLDHSTLLKHLSGSIISSRKVILAFEIRVDDDAFGLKLDAVKNLKQGK